MLSVTAIAVITLTGSELSMSVMTTDRGRALQAAQAGAEKAAQIIDEKVAQAQEDARVESSRIIQGKIAGFKNYPDSNGEYTVVETITPPFVGILDNYTNPAEVRIINEKALNKIYEDEYKFQFNIMITKAIKEQTDLIPGNSFDMNAISPSGDSAGGKFTYEVVDLKYSTEVSSPVGSDLPTGYVFQNGPNGKTAPITSIVIKSTGEYKSASSTGSTYKRSIQTELGLLTESKGSSADIPVSYARLTKVRANKDDKPSILKNALIAEKNIISVDGTVNVNGDVVNCGTVPKKTLADGITTENDYNADSYEFGGIMAGMTISDNKISDAPNTWLIDGLGSRLNSYANAIGGAADYFDNKYFFTSNLPGSFIIEGNVATLGYLHSLYSSTDSKQSKITVSGNTYARSVKLESDSNYSTAQFKNLYIWDDLKIDGNNCEVKIGDWDTNTYEGLLVGLNKGTETDSRTSSAVIVSGDSNLYINGEVYVGGSTFYNDYIDAEKNPYVSGMSIQKSDSRPAEAFEFNDINTDATDAFTGNVFYWYNNNPNVPADDNYTLVKASTETERLITKDYSNPYYTDTDPNAAPKTVSMMEGCNSRSLFYIADRAMHLKYIWDHFWKGDIGYESYFNTGDIQIETNNNKLKGFCYGGVAANDTIYGPYTGFSETEAAYDIKAGVCKTAYADAMDLFVKDIEGLDGINPASRKSLSESVNKQDPVTNVATLTPNELYVDTTKSCAFMYYTGGNDESKKNVILKNDSVSNENGSGPYSLSKDSGGYLNGIIYSEGDIYVQPGTKFRGILIAEGNIVFLGTADIKYDGNVVDNLLSQQQSIGRFFKYSAYDLIMNDQNAFVQTVKKSGIKNIKIISWKEV
jgi:hypothetical protein